MSGPAGTQRGDRARAGTDVAGVARSAWDTRPARRQEDTKLAGVAGAIARRYDLDPTLVRVAFVVWTIVGGGLLLYLLGWLVLPPDPADPPRRDRALGGRAPRRPYDDPHHHRRPTGPPVLVIILTVIAAAATLTPAFSGRIVTLVALGLAGLALYLLHTARADLGVPGTPGTAGPLAAPWSAPWAAPEAEPWAADDEAPLAWDPLGAAPRGWSLPAEPPPHTPAGDPVRRPRSVLTPVTLALALVAAGLAGAALLTGVPWVSPVWILAAALAVVGLGLVVGSVAPRRPRRGLVIAAMPLIVVTVLGSLAAAQPGRDAPWTGQDGAVSRGAGDVTAAPTLPATVAPDYRTGLGDIDLDLSRLAVAPVGGPPVRTTVQSGAGDVTVRVPATADVTVSCATGLGDMNCLGATSDVTNRVDLGPDGPGGPVVDLTVRSGAGDVAVTRG